MVSCDGMGTVPDGSPGAVQDKIARCRFREVNVCVCARARVCVCARAQRRNVEENELPDCAHAHTHTHTRSHVIIASCTSMYNFIYICNCTFTQICINRRSGWRSATRYSTPSKSRRRTQEQVAPLHVYCLLSFSHALSVPLSLQLTHSVSHARRPHACTHIHDRAQIHTRTQADDAQNGSASGGSGILRQQSGGSFSLSDVGGRLEEIVDGLSHGGVDDDAGWRSPLPSPRHCTSAGIHSAKRVERVP